MLVNTRERLSALAVALPLAWLAAAPALAGDEDRDATAAEKAQVTLALEAKGYTEIHDLEVEDCRYEVEARNPAGEDVELELNLKTLAILDEDD